MNQLSLIGFFSYQGLDVFTISQNLDTVGKFEDLLESVGNVNNRYTLFLKQSYDCKHILYFFACKRCGRFVHDQNLGILLNCLRNLYHLLITYCQILDKFIWIDLDLKLCKGFGSLFIHCFPIDRPAMADRSSQEKVLCCGKFSDIIELLINDSDTVFCSKLRCHSIKYLAVDLDLA